MSRPTPLSATFAHSRWGRAALHFACLMRGGRRRWHLRGIVREVFGLHPNSSGIVESHDETRVSNRLPISARERQKRLPVSRHMLCAFVLSALSGGGFQVFAFPGTPVLDLLATAPVDGSGIYLHQIVSALQPGSAPPIRLANSPAFGQPAFLTRVQVTELLKTAAPELATNIWSGAAQVRITRRARLLAERELREILTATLQQEVVKDRGELELRFSRPWAPVYVPDEPLALKIIDLPASGVGPNFITRFEVIAGADRVGPWQVVAQARVMKDVLIARQALKRGQPLQDSDFIIERRDVLSLREPLEESILANPAFELVESVSAGQPLLARALRLRPIVQRGQMVDGLVRDGSLNISLKVEVLADGQPGQVIRVRNPKTKREFHAKVQNEQTVVINL